MEVPGQAIGLCVTLGPWRSSPVVSVSSFLKEVWKRHGSWALSGTRWSRWRPGAGHSVLSPAAWLGQLLPLPRWEQGTSREGPRTSLWKGQVSASLACALGFRRCWSWVGLCVCGLPQVVSTHGAQR